MSHSEHSEPPKKYKKPYIMLNVSEYNVFYYYLYGVNRINTYFLVVLYVSITVSGERALVAP